MTVLFCHCLRKHDLSLLRYDVYTYIRTTENTPLTSLIPISDSMLTSSSVRPPNLQPSPPLNLSSPLCRTPANIPPAPLKLPSPSLLPFPNPYPPTESPSAQTLISILNLSPHVEGGYFVEIDRDPLIPHPFFPPPYQSQPSQTTEATPNS